MTEEKNPLQSFVEHQGRALQEVGKAALSLLPKGLRDHSWNAVEESAKGFKVLGEAVADEVGKVADKLTPKKSEEKEANKEVSEA